MSDARIKIATFGQLRSRAITIYPTIREHVLAHAGTEALECLGEAFLVTAYTETLTGILIGYNIVLDGEDLYCAEPYGLEPFRISGKYNGLEPLAEALDTAEVVIGGPILDKLTDHLLTPPE
jgi:hypothetical protein